MIYSNDDMELSDGKKSFITEHNSSFIVPATEKKVVVFKLEDVDPPSSINGNPIPLPENSNYSRVVDNILRTIKASNKKFTKEVSLAWREYFESTACKAILSDMFWYCLVKLDKRPDCKDYKKSLLERISYNYVQVFVSVKREDKEYFFENFYDCIAQGVFYSMFFSYPKSRTRLTSEDFKAKLFETVSSKLTGINVNNQSYKKWTLDLGARDVLKEFAERSKDNSAPGSLPNVGKRQTRRTMQQLRYSPFVSRYLHAKRYEAINSVPSWSMRYTLRNIEKEEDIEKKFKYYKKLAYDTERKALERKKDFQEYSTRIDKEINEEHRKNRRSIKRLNQITKEMIKEGVSEYANKLVALGMVQREEKKQGYIPLVLDNK